ncbi:tail component protein [Streptomyces phage mu1/6]|uniref:tail component protein n=1 Tax=Streptomyces phage mu1/6 TaxID=370623 RepID=UPI0000D4F6D5|nr:tail component protein [Streptomyces phage mu1/6]ABD94204.1 tail component protein [Streptomyces phage mu1/6]
MAGLNYRVNSTEFQGALRAALDRLTGAAREATEAAANDMVNMAKGLCPVDTGRLRSSIQAVPSGGRFSFSVTIGTNVTYAADVEYGTAPHVIVPKDKKALYWPGAAHPVAKVNHPGTRAQPFMRPAIAAASTFLRNHAKGIR